MQIASARLCKSRHGASAHKEKNASAVRSKAIASLTRAVDSLRPGDLY